MLKFTMIALMVWIVSTGPHALAEPIMPASQRFVTRETADVPDFQRHVIPLLGKLGCNSAACHGSFQGQGGFRLSLFGFDFSADHLALHARSLDHSDQRVNLDVPPQSLIVSKPTEQADHEGGQLFEPGSWHHHLLLRWIESGGLGTKPADPGPAPESESAYGHSVGATHQVLIDLHYEPTEIQFEAPGDGRSLRIVAQWDDGTYEDVTCLTRFRSNDDSVVRVDADGVATAVGPGDTHIIAFYDNGVAAIPVVHPYGTPDEWHIESNPQGVDRFVNAKLRQVGLVPSKPCTDAEFLRRVRIDMTGTLPTPEEVTLFLQDASEDKRNRKVDELLQLSTYAAWWANKLCDFTGCNPKSISSLLEVAREEGYVKASQWYDWIYDRVARNEPYDRLAAGMMLADLAGQDDGMPLFWKRQSLQEPKDTAMSVAHAFLGIQLQCAECHKHPFDRWSQSDFNQFAQFFDSITKSKRRAEVSDHMELRLLRSERIQLQPGDDPRRPIMEWMRMPDNPWFARAFVNRVWASYFHRGIVDPPDQFTPANPPSNPPLLDWLAGGFIDSGYDMKWLHRQIATSDAYQRSWRPNATNRNDRRNFSRSIPRRVPAEVVYDAMKQATAATEDQSEVRADLRRRTIGHLSMRMAGTHAMKVFGKPDRSINCDCERVNEPTLLQAIFTQNDPLVRMRIADSGWLFEVERLEDGDVSLNPNRLARQVWLRTVGRHPRTSELDRATAHLASTSSITEGLADLMWAMLNTKEFLLNH